MVDYGLLSPEVNSGRLYAGPGSAPMMTAASAWRGLAGEITSALTSYETVISQLADEEWMGPASASMAAAAKPQLEWMTSTAATAEQAAAQAAAAAAAFETAHASTPPPAVIAANRAHHAQLVATNSVGQNIAAIMASEAQYLEMWAQATGVMYSYAASSATAARLSPFTQPAQTTNPAGQGAQAAATAQAAGTSAGSTAQTAQLISSLPNAIQGLTSPAAAGLPPPTIAGLVEAFFRNASINGVVSLLTYPVNGGMSFVGTSVAYMPASLIPTMTTFFSGGGFNALGGGSAGAGLGALLGPGGPLGNLGALGGGVGAGASAASAASGLSGLGGGASAVTASLGQASTVGEFSAPATWAAAIPESAGAAAVQSASWTTGSEHDSMAAMPGGVPPGGGGRGGFGFGAPRYGFKPTVMGRPVIA